MADEKETTATHGEGGIYTHEKMAEDFGKSPEEIQKRQDERNAEAAARLGTNVKSPGDEVKKAEDKTTATAAAAKAPATKKATAKTGKKK